MYNMMIQQFYTLLSAHESKCTLNLLHLFHSAPPTSPLGTASLLFVFKSLWICLLLFSFVRSAAFLGTHFSVLLCVDWLRQVKQITLCHRWTEASHGNHNKFYLVRRSLCLWIMGGLDVKTSVSYGEWGTGGGDDWAEVSQISFVLEVIDLAAVGCWVFTKINTRGLQGGSLS